VTNLPDPTQLPPLSWVETDREALAANARCLIDASRRTGRQPSTCVMVKGNAYGHGRVVAARAFVQAGVDWLGVADLFEALALREAGIAAPLYNVVLTPPEHAAAAVAADVAMVTADADAIDAAAAAAVAQGRTARIHLKLETGTHRQGIALPELLALAARCCDAPGVVLEGVASHYADVEDTTDHRFADEQRRRFDEGVAAVRALLADRGRDPAALLAHTSNSAALLLWPEHGADLVRFGIAAYGLWPSKETFLSAQQLGQRPIPLRPALTWKTRVVQVKEVPAGAYVGYGRTFRTLRPTRLGILPVGYADGYDRGLSGRGQVLVRGRRAPVVGRVAMNLTAIDLTDTPEARRGDEVVLLGAQGDDAITAESMAAALGTIHYEVTTRIAERLPRIPR
jgi:alanine racemase